MVSGNELIQALELVSKEKGIDKEEIFLAIEDALVLACKKNFGANANFVTIINRETGNIRFYNEKLVVEEVIDENSQISLDDAKKIDDSYEVDQAFRVEFDEPAEFGRITAQTAKQVLINKIRDIERDKTYNIFKERENDLINGVVQRIDKKNVFIEFGEFEGMLTAFEQIPNEQYKVGDRIKAVVTEAKQTKSSTILFLSRSNTLFIQKLFETEIPEISDGTIQIKSVSRDAGNRTKIAVVSNDQNVEAVGSCIGHRGHRVNNIISELNGEQIDIVNYSEDIRLFIASALSPSSVLTVVVKGEEKTARVVVPDDQLSLAIGKKGQNVSLAARLTGYKIDIKSEHQAEEVNFVNDKDYDDFAELFRIGNYKVLNENIDIES